MSRAGWWAVGILAAALVVGSLFFWAPNPGPGATGEPTGFRQNTPSGQRISNRPNTPDVTTNDAAIARRVATAANQVPGVKTSYAFVTNRTAYVGITPGNQTTNNTNANQLEDMVARRIKTDPAVDRAVVSSNPAQVRRIRKVSDGLASGKSLADFNGDVNGIMRQMRPMG